ncbi:MAG: hypothetical protein ABSF62_14035 [Bryobacteraceae bacterium]|jgi:hypothetical protein
MRWRFAGVIFAMAGFCAWAQDQPPIPAASAPIAAAPVVLENSGKPMLLPFACTPDDVQWAGLSCLEDSPCPIFLELTAATSAGDKFFAAGNIHSAAVTLYSVLLGSDNAGRTWREIHPRIRGAGLDHLQFADTEAGWAAGQQLFPLPQEPFVLLTTDGGKTWRQQNILNENAENRFGSILEFRFGSKTSGGAVVDRGQGSDAGRYALFESPNGGETWRIKEESSKPLHLKLASTEPAEWRVRADAASESFHLERRLGDRWISRAAFAVKIGACKPPE